MRKYFIYCLLLLIGKVFSRLIITNNNNMIDSLATSDVLSRSDDLSRMDNLNRDYILEIKNYKLQVSLIFHFLLILTIQRDNN